MQNFGRFTITGYLPPAQPLSIDTGMNWEYIRIINNSPYLLSLNFSGLGTIDFPEMYLEDIRVPTGYTGKLVITPVINLSNVSQAISRTVSINAWSVGELATPQAQPLTQQAVSTTASGKPVFSATIGFGATVNADQVLNVFNPPNSGVNYTFHSARTFTNSSQTGLATTLYVQPGADNNYGTPVSAVSHMGVVNPPVSTAHCTGTDANLGVSGAAVQVEVYNTAQNVTADFLDFPDTFILEPGNNLFMIMPGGSGHVVRYTLKWSEDIIVPPVGGLPLGIATSVQQDGQPSGNPIVEATPSGGVGQTILITTDGKMTLAGPVTLAGNLLANGGINVNTIRDDTNGNPALDLSAGTGSVKFPQLIQLNETPTTINGSAGSISFFTPIWGSAFKVLWIDFNGYTNAGASNFTFPSAFAHCIGVIGGLNSATARVVAKSGASAVSTFDISTLAGAAAAGTIANPGTGGWFQGTLAILDSAWDNISIGALTTATGCMVFIGR